MEAANLQIYWHESQPIYSLCFQPAPSKATGNRRLVTAGGDNKIRVWQLNFSEENKYKVDTIDFLSSLTQHEQAVNVARFDSKGEILATAGDDGLLLLWKKNNTIVKEFGIDDEEFADFKESWYILKRLRPSSSAGASEVYDLCWSPDNRYIVTGSMDNTVRIFDTEDGSCISQALGHSHYVQGVVWDPQDEFIISQSADRSVHIYKIIRDQEKGLVGLKLSNKITKGDLPCRKTSDPKELDRNSLKTAYLFHNETLPSFFRRLTMSPCGSLLCVPTGIFKNSESGSESNSSEFANAVYIYTRSSLVHSSNKPVICLPFLKKPALAISFNPNYYKLTKDSLPCINLPYKLVYAVATSNEVLIYDTESVKPLAVIGNLHYTPLTDINWCQDGKLLMISSTDGFCSYVSIKDGLLGEVWTDSTTTLERDDVAAKTDKKGVMANSVNHLVTKRKNCSKDHKTSVSETKTKKAKKVTSTIASETSTVDLVASKNDATDKKNDALQTHSQEPKLPDQKFSAANVNEKPKRRVQPILVSKETK